MKRVLLTWEIGAGLGHMTRLSALARSLTARGYTVTAALRDLSRAHLLFADLPVTLLQAPTWLHKVTMQRPVACLPDTLLLSGYFDSGALSSLVRAWDGLLTLVKPDLMICDYAPTALLASHNLGIPRFVVGPGFAEPAPGHPVADWRPHTVADGLAARQEQQLLEIINPLLPRQGDALTRLADLYQVDGTFITNFPDLDVYNGQRHNAVYCPLQHSANNNPAQWPDGDGPGIVAYLNPDYSETQPLMRALADSGARVVVVCPDRRASLLQPFASARLHLASTVIDLQRTIGEADLLISHGGNGVTCQSLAAGKPHLVLPMQLEQLLTGIAVRRLAVGEYCERITDSEHASALIAAAQTAAARSNAQAFAERHRTLSNINPIETMATACDDLLQAS